MLQIKTGDIASLLTELLMIPVAEEASVHGDSAIKGLVEKAKTYNEFKGEKGDELLLYQPDGVKARRVLFLGVGKTAAIEAESLRKAGGRAAKKAIKLEAADLLIVLPEAKKMPIDASSAVEALFEGAYLGNHIFDHYKGDKKHTPVKRMAVFANDAAARACRKIPERVETICKSTVLAREWVSMPPNEKRPDRFARSIVKAADKEGIDITVLDQPEIKKNKMGGILSVEAGSKCRARMVILDYNPAKAKKTYALIGKGVTFDAGGINLKPTGSLEDMKMDMGGAASVAAAVIAAARLKSGYRVLGVMPIVENMPSSDAARPGDIIRTYAGKTVEIGNTDAEGRMILIDAMAYAERVFNPDIMVDIATLTGACLMALGEKIAGVFSPDKNLSEAILAAGETVYERCWALPMPDDYRELLKSDFADLRNIGSSRWGGAIVAALFLSNFVENARWAHIDIAGPAYAKKASDYCEAGGTGFGVRLLIETMEKLMKAT